MQLASFIPKLLMKPEAQHMGQQIVGNLAQRTIARLIREWLLTSNTDTATPPRQSKHSSNQGAIVVAS